MHEADGVPEVRKQDVSCQITDCSVSVCFFPSVVCRCSEWTQWHPPSTATLFFSDWSEVVKRCLEHTIVSYLRGAQTCLNKGYKGIGGTAGTI